MDADLLRPDDTFFVVCRSRFREITWAKRVCFACLAGLYQLFVGTLISLTNAYASCGRPTLNFIELMDLGRSVPTEKLLHLVTYVQNVD